MPTPADQTTSPSPDQVLEQPQPSSTTEAQPEQPLPVAPEQPNPSTTTPDPTTTTTTANDDEDTTTSAIPPANTNASPSSGPALEISLMLITGARHPYRIDEKYLSSRNVTARNPSTGAFDPRELSGYQLKELILKDWRSEWEPKPASPSSIRLIIMGRMIEDKAALKGKTHIGCTAFEIASRLTLYAKTSPSPPQTPMSCTSASNPPKSPTTTKPPANPTQAKAAPSANEKVPTAELAVDA